MLERLKKLIGYEEKRQLCFKIAQTHCEHARYYKIISGISRGVMESSNPPDAIYEALRYVHLKIMHGVNLEESKKYEELSSSWKLYIPRLVKRKLLQERLETISRPIKLPL